MKRIKHILFFILAPVILVAAVILFILDNLNVNVSPISAYLVKAGQD